MAMRTLFNLLGAVSASNPNDTYMKERHPDGWREASFREVLEESRRVAGFLLAEGLAKGDRVTLFAEGRNAWTASEFGTVFAGGICVPISIKIKERSEILFRMRHSGSRFAITSLKYLDRILDLAADLPELRGVLVMDPLPSPQASRLSLWSWNEVLGRGGDFVRVSGERLREIERSASEDDPVTLTYTSGTTAEPKGILLSHKNYWVNTTEADAVFPLPKPLYTLLIIPWDHSFGQTAGLFIFLNKASVVAALEPGKNEMATIRNIPKCLKEVGPTFLLVVPALVDNFRKNILAQIRQKGGLSEMLFTLTLTLGTRLNGDSHRGRHDPLSLLLWPGYLALRAVIRGGVRQALGGRIVFMISGGSACSIEHVRWFHALGLPVHQGYGLSETSPIIASNSNLKGNSKIGSVGKPLPWAQVRITGEDGAALPAGQTGEICVRGDCVMLGYWRNEAATREAIVEGWFHTGDLGYLDADGFLFVAGRIKSLLVGENGEKYSPEALEQHLVDSVPFFQQAMLYNQQDPFTVALVAPEPNAIRDFMASRGITGGTAAELDQVLEAMRGHLMRYRKDPALTSQFVSTWTPKTFALVPEAFSEENGMMNASMKIVRRKILARYGERLRRLYGPEEDPLNGANREVLRSWLERARP
jgi:long-chain acyl-CoA synthetase